MYNMNKLKIGINTLAIVPGSSGSNETYVVNLVRALATVDESNEYIIFGMPKNRFLFEDALVAPNFTICILPNLAQKYLIRIFLEQIILPLLAILLKVDVMHYPATVGPLVIRNHDVVTVHFDPISQRNSVTVLKRLYFDFLLPHASRAGRLITPTTTYAYYLSETYGFLESELCAIPHGISPEIASPEKQSKEKLQQEWNISPRSVLSVTNTLPHKNVSRLIAAYNRLILADILVGDLVLVGYIDATIVKDFVKDVSDNPTKLLQRIRIIPFLTHAELREIYQACSVFAFVSLIETYGIPPIEAMACGLPVVASDIEVHREVYGDVPIFVDPENEVDIFESLRVLLVNDEERKMRITAGSKWSSKYTWFETAKLTRQVYLQAYKNKFRKHNK